MLRSPPVRLGHRAVLAASCVLLGRPRDDHGRGDITSSGTLRATLVASIPIALAGLGGLWSERAGVVNIGLEGMMILGTYGAGYFGYHYGAWAGVIRAVAWERSAVCCTPSRPSSSASTTSSRVWRSTSSRWAPRSTSRITFSGLPGGGPTQSPKIADVPSITVPGVSRRGRRPRGQGLVLHLRRGPLLRALSPPCRSSRSSRSACRRAPVRPVADLFGLRLRSCGESPAAAESLGVNVLRYKFIAVLVSGGLPAWAAPTSPSWRPASTATVRPVAAATSAWPR